jgi:hypothetical protein
MNMVHVHVRVKPELVEAFKAATRILFGAGVLREAGALAHAIRRLTGRDHPPRKPSVGGPARKPTSGIPHEDHFSDISAIRLIQGNRLDTGVS